MVTQNLTKRNNITPNIKLNYVHQSLVASVVINAEFSREDHSSIPATAIERGWNHLMSELTLEPDSTGGENQKNKLNYVDNWY
jgi:hypothetical protein